MLKLNVNQEKQLTFEVQIGGVQSEQVQSYLRINIDDIEYGFPAEVGRESISVNLPALRTVTGRKLKEGEEVQVKLEIIADGNYLTPWTDTFRLSNPLVIEAKIVDDEFNPAPAFKTKLVQEGKSGEQRQGVRVEKIEGSEVKVEDNDEDALTERIVNKLAEKLSGSFGGKKKRVVEQEEDEKEEKEGEEDEKEEKEVEEKCKTEDVKSLKKLSKKDLLNMTEEGVYAYMERAGTKNPQVQKIIYEQAEAKAGSSKPVLVLQQVVKMLKAKNK